jgi:hypothetical protein
MLAPKSLNKNIEVQHEEPILNIEEPVSLILKSLSLSLIKESASAKILKQEH